MPPLRLVIDTNVALDLLHWHDPSVARLRQTLLDGDALWLTDDDCADEFRRVLAYPEFKLDPAAQSALASQYRGLARALPAAEWMPARDKLPLCRDPDDQKFVVLAVAVRADVLLTRDKALLKLARRIRNVAPQLLIATPKALLQKSAVPAAVA